MADAHYNLALAYDRLYQQEAAHSHFNTFRSMVGGRERNGKNGTETDRAGREGNLTRRAPAQGRPPPKASPSAARRGRPKWASTKSPLGRQPPAPPPAAKGANATGDPKKWWTQDRFNQKR